MTGTLTPLNMLTAGGWAGAVSHIHQISSIHSLHKHVNMDREGEKEWEKGGGGGGGGQHFPPGGENTPKA